MVKFSQISSILCTKWRFLNPNRPKMTQNGPFCRPLFATDVWEVWRGRPRYAERYGVHLKSFVIKYGGMAYRGEGAGSYQKVNSAPGQPATLLRLLQPSRHNLAGIRWNKRAPSRGDSGSVPDRCGSCYCGVLVCSCRGNSRK